MRRKGKVEVDVRDQKLVAKRDKLSPCFLVSPTFTETMMEGEKTREGESNKQGCGGITRGGTPGSIISGGRITGSSMGDM